MFGGGMRQAGILTSAARVALTEHFHKLPYTHELAQWLAEEASKLGAEIIKPVDTSMVSCCQIQCILLKCWAFSILMYFFFA